jgi:hypothetical protein
MKRKDEAMEREAEAARLAKLEAEVARLEAEVARVPEQTAESESVKTKKKKGASSRASMWGCSENYQGD